VIVVVAGRRPKASADPAAFPLDADVAPGLEAHRRVVLRSRHSRPPPQRRSPAAGGSGAPALDPHTSAQSLGSRRHQLADAPGRDGGLQELPALLPPAALLPRLSRAALGRLGHTPRLHQES
jgi:hypothetical protein